MKRLLLMLVLVLLLMVLVVAPALAWYAPKPHTAYVSPFDKTGWAEWAGPSDPLNVIAHTGAIPHGWEVVVSLTWLDSQTGARLAPIVLQHTFSFSKVNGAWSKKALSPQRAVRFWSPAYEWDAVGAPGLYGSDWWVPLGKLAKGTYKGWFKEQIVSEYPTWVDENGTILTDPIWNPASSARLQRTFTVK
jgi:hypothetical protein